MTEERSQLRDSDAKGESIRIDQRWSHENDGAYRFASNYPPLPHLGPLEEDTFQSFGIAGVDPDALQRSIHESMIRFHLRADIEPADARDEKEPATQQSLPHIVHDFDRIMASYQQALAGLTAFPPELLSVLHRVVASHVRLYAARDRWHRDVNMALHRSSLAAHVADVPVLPLDSNERAAQVLEGCAEHGCRAKDYYDAQQQQQQQQQERQQQKQQEIPDETRPHQMRSVNSPSLASDLEQRHEAMNDRPDVTEQRTAPSALHYRVAEMFFERLRPQFMAQVQDMVAQRRQDSEFRHAQQPAATVTVRTGGSRTARSAR